MSPLPVLFYVGDVPVYSHGFFLLFGLLAGLGWLVIEARRRHWTKEEVIPITLAAFVGGMIGAKVSILFFNGFEYAPIVLNMYAMFDPRIGPGSIIGGVAGAYIGGYIASKAIGKDKCSCDAFAPAMALATAWDVSFRSKTRSANRRLCRGACTCQLNMGEVIWPIPRRCTTWHSI